jgi:hypothetical protein
MHRIEVLDDIEEHEAAFTNHHQEDGFEKVRT